MKISIQAPPAALGKKVGEIAVFKAEDNEDLTVSAADCDLSEADFLIFDGEGRLYQAGGQLSYASKSKGSVQNEFIVPAGGFALGFDSKKHPELFEVKLKATENIPVYNSTAHVIYPAVGSYEEETGRVCIDCPETDESENDCEILFIGNSATYFNLTPLKLKALCAAAGIKIGVSAAVAGGADLEEFTKKGSECQKKLDRLLYQKSFSLAIMQDTYSSSAEKTDKSLQKLLHKLNTFGVEGALYMRCPAEKDKEKRMKGALKMREIYTALCCKYDLKVAPAACAFRECLRTDNAENPKINLFAGDKMHLSAAGSYLVACTMLYSLFGADPVGNPYSPLKDADITLKLQKIARDECKKYAKFKKEARKAEKKLQREL